MGITLKEARERRCRQRCKYRMSFSHNKRSPCAKMSAPTLPIGPFWSSEEEDGVDDGVAVDDSVGDDGVPMDDIVRDLDTDNIIIETASETTGLASVENSSKVSSDKFVSTLDKNDVFVADIKKTPNLGQVAPKLHSNM